MILVTGGLGFIGSHVVNQLLADGEDVVATRHVRAEVPDFLAGELGHRLAVEPLDVTDAAAVAGLLRRYRVDGIVHLATPPRSGVGAVAEARTAVGGMLAVVEAGAEAGVGRIGVASSVTIYGPAGGPLREDLPLSLDAGNSVQATKIAEEALGSYLARDAGLDLVFLRIAGIFGPCYRTLLNVPARLCHFAAGHGERVASLPDPLAGHPEDAWDLCYVKDCARAVCLVQRAPSLAHRTYNVGTGSLTSLAELVDAVEQAGPVVPLRLGSPSGPPARHGSAMDIGRLEELGYRPAWGTKESIRDYLDWLRDHER